jgi:DUF917 family protein
MQDDRLGSLQDCEDLLVGSTWMATGGGGSIHDGLAELSAALNEGLSLGWVAASDIPDDVWSLTVAVHGAITPTSDKVLAEVDRLGMQRMDGNSWVAESVKELGDFLALDFGCLVPCEVGPGAFADALIAGARLGMAVIDGDYSGRAGPEEMQATYCLHDKQRPLFASVDQWGTRVIVKQAANVHMLERLAKNLALAGYGAAAIATTPLLAGEMKQIIVHETMSKSIRIGRAIRNAREAGEDLFRDALQAADAWRLFEGQVIGWEIEDIGGYSYGTTRMKGGGEFSGQELQIWFKNENHVSWLNGEPWICSPDLLTLVYAEDGRGPRNSEIRVGDRLVAIGMKGDLAFRSQRGLGLAGPQHFGFDIDYVAIEDLVEVGAHRIVDSQEEFVPFKA